MGNRYIRQGGQTANHGGQTKKSFWRFAPNFIKQMFAHPESLPAPLHSSTNNNLVIKFCRKFLKSVYRK